MTINFDGIHDASLFLFPSASWLQSIPLTPSRCGLRQSLQPPPSASSSSSSCPHLPRLCLLLVGRAPLLQGNHHTNINDHFQPQWHCLKEWCCGEKWLLKPACYTVVKVDGLWTCSFTISLSLSFSRSPLPSPPPLPLSSPSTGVMLCCWSPGGCIHASCWNGWGGLQIQRWCFGGFQEVQPA